VPRRIQVRRPPLWALLTAGLVLAAAVVGFVFVVDAGRVHRPAAAPLPVAVVTGTASTGDRLAGPLPAAAASPVTVTASPTRQTGLGPSSIRIPSLGVTASIGAATVVNGVLTPPRIPNEVGAWAGSAPLNGTTGEVTIAGHVNWAGMAPFAFGQLARVHPGDLVYTTDASAAQTAWRVVSVAARPKTQPIDANAFAGTKGTRRLVLITCGGAFDSASSSYDDNVYVYADPLVG
jgi:hypothetical protein